MFQQMGGKGMAEHVGSDILLNPGLQGIVFDDFPHPLARQLAAVMVHKELLPGARL